LPRISAYQKRALRVEAPLISDPAAAQHLADYLLDAYKNPINQVSNVEIIANKNATWMAAVRDLELLDRVVISETQTGMSSVAMYVSSMRHRYINRYEHRMILGLETAYTIAGTPFRLDTSALNSGHVLIY